MNIFSLASKAVFLFCVFNLFGATSQEKYPSLLWKIEGNGLDKASYLYGTMHVSSKIAFNLGDEFFEALSSTDAVALESNPELWLDFYQGDALTEASKMVYNRSGSLSGRGFYNKFLDVPSYDMDGFQQLLAPQQRLLNQLLYRYNYGEENYEETTYLDMFLYQSARKDGKQIFSLEDFIESFFLGRRSSLPDEDEEEGSDYNSRQMSQEDLETAYLERNLDLLDSMITENFSKNYRKYLLNIRNENMVAALDSLMPKLSLFSGVGAAHLPGEKGMIELLREKGYKVSAVKFDKSSGANKTFKKIKKAAVDLPLSKHTSEDGRIKMKSIGKFYPQEMNKRATYKKGYFLPDFANGAYYSYERMIKLPFAENYKEKGSLRYIDSVLYLITPGDIDKQKSTSVGDYNAIEVTSELSRNNYIKLLIVDTPEEIITFKASGNKSFIKSKNVKNYFKSIEIEPRSSPANLKNIGVDIVLPENQVVTHKDKGNVLIFAKDKDNKLFTFHSEYLTDFSNLEEDKFELNYLVESFAKTIDYEVKEIDFKEKSVTATLTNEAEKLFVHYKIYHNFYYQLITDASEAKALEYFKSLKFTAPDYDQESRHKEVDTLLNFSFNSYYKNTVDSVLYAELKSLREDFIEAENKDDSLNRDYEEKYNTRVYNDPVTGVSVLVRHSKLNKYYSIESGLEEVRDRIMLKFHEDSLYYTTKILNETKSDSSFQIEYTYTKNGSDRILHCFETIIGNEYVTLTSSYDTTLSKPVFVEQLLETFRSEVKKSGEDYLIHPKGQLWLKDLQSDEYQLKQQAKESIGEVVFDEKSKAELENVLMNDTLEIIDEELRLELLYKYFYFFNEDEGSLTFLTRFYNKFKDNPDIQVDVLQKISALGTSESTEMFMSAIESTPPMTNDFYDIYYLFSVYEDSSHLLKPIITRLTDFALEYEEFLPRVIYLIDRANFKGGFTTNELPEDFLAELEKRAKKTLRKINFSENESELEDLRREMLELGSVLYCYDKQKDRFQEVLEKVDTISNKHFKANLLAKRINRKQPYELEEVNEVISDTAYVYPFFMWVDSEREMDSLFKSTKVSKALVYHSYAIENSDYNVNKDSIKHHSTITTSTFKEAGEVYIYTSEGNYGSKQLLAVYFVDPEANIDTKSLSIKTKRYEDEGDFEEALDELIKRVEYSNRPRVENDSYYY
ncbi:MAG: TraB/GumN family protein [Brumimicrobium sp.]